MKRKTLIIGVLALGLPLQGLAQEDGAPATAEWSFSASLYGWFPDLKGDTRFGQAPGGGSVEVPIDTILDNLEFTFQGAFTARKGRWGVLADVIYMDVAGSQTLPALDNVGGNPLPPDVSGTASLDLESWTVTVAGLYRVGEGKGRTMDVLLGTRYLDISQSLAWNLEGDLGMFPLEREGRRDAGGDGFDAVVGVRGRLAWGEESRWYTPYHFDVGTGDSDVTWQLVLGAGYAFGWGDIALVYRQLDYDFASGQALEDLQFKGPALGVSFRF